MGVNWRGKRRSWRNDFLRKRFARSAPGRSGWERFLRKLDLTEAQALEMAKGRAVVPINHPLPAAGHDPEYRRQLREWARRNGHYRFVPEAVLAALGIVIYESAVMDRRGNWREREAEEDV